MVDRFEVDSPFPGDNRIKELAKKALEASPAPQDPSRTSEDVGIPVVD